MARIVPPVCRLCRREGRKLYLKGEKCESPKCPVSKRAYPPGQHGANRSKVSPYGQQLREKQRVKRIYGVLERQFRRYFEVADRFHGVTGTNLLVLLERRLDNLVFRLGLAPARRAARQLITHGNIRVNGKRTNVPSYLIRVGDAITLADDMRENSFVKRALENVERSGRPKWMEFDSETMTGRMTAMPSREDVTMEIQEQLIVELYSK